MNDRIDAIRKRRAAIAAEGWHVFDKESNPPMFSRVLERGSNFLIAEVGSHSDAEFIAAAPADIDYLLGEVDYFRRRGDAIADANQLLSRQLQEKRGEVERLRTVITGYLDRYEAKDPEFNYYILGLYRAVGRLTKGERDDD